MKKGHFYILTLLVLLLWGCKSQQAGSDSRYKRKPIVEVTEEQLKSEAALIDAKTQQELGHETEALEAYKKMLEAYPACAAAHYEMGQILEKRGWLDSALACTKRAHTLDPDNVWYSMLLAQIYQDQQDGKNLTATWESIVKKNPEVLEYYYELSNSYLMANDVHGAIEVLNRVEKRYGITEMVSLQKQKLWNAIGKADKARKEIETLAAAMPNEKKYAAILAESYMQEKNYAKAKQYYDQVLAADPNDEYVNISLAEFYKRTGDMGKAQEHLRRGLQGPNLSTKNKVTILSGFYTNEEFYVTYAQQAFALLEEIMEQCEDSTTYALFYGDVLMRQQKYNEAIHQFKNYLSADSSQYVAWEALLICLSATSGREDELINYAQRASELFPFHGLPNYLQGEVYLQRGEYEKALEHLTQCENLGFTKGYLQVETYALIADCEYHLAHYERAWHYFELCLKVEPDNIGILNNFAYYLTQQNIDLDRAEKMSRTTIEKEPNNPTYLDTYAWVLHRMGNSCKACLYIDKAVKIDNNGSATLKEHQEIIHQACKK